MGGKPQRRGLEDEILCRHTSIMERMAVRGAILELQFRHRQQQRRCAMRPSLIAFDQAIEQPIILSLIFFRSDQEPPRLFVI